MEKRFNYFAYGSNMNEQRMLERCPGARLVGKATLAGYRLVERLYADVEPLSGKVVEGVLWTVTESDVYRLDGYEGVEHGIYARKVRRVRIGGRFCHALCYEMTPRTRRVRNGIPYPDKYREICSLGAQAHGVADLFTKTA